MATRYSIAEARAQLAAIIDLAEAGSEIELTRRGQPVAVILSARDVERLKGREENFAAAYQRFIERFPAEGASVEKDFARSLRDRSAGRDVSL